MREYVLAPIFLEHGHTWNKAMRLGSAVLGTGKWDAAFKAASDRYGPFDPVDGPRTVGGERAWTYWTKVHVRVRGQLVHAELVHEPTAAAVREVLFNVGQMAEWYRVQLATSGKHPIGQALGQAIAAARALLDDAEPNDS
jgi:hypothetical protein